MVITAYVCSVTDGFPLATMLVKGGGEVVALPAHLGGEFCGGSTVYMVINADFCPTVIKRQTASETLKNNKINTFNI